MPTPIFNVDEALVEKSAFIKKHNRNEKEGATTAFSSSALKTAGQAVESNSGWEQDDKHQKPCHYIV